MSNEKDTCNRPPKSNKRYRGFCLTSYLNCEQIKSVLLKHDRNIRAYAFILHDKDMEKDGTLKKPHYHILIQLVNNTTVSAIRSWFKGFFDSKEMPINTLAQPMHDINASFDYLTHDTEHARAEGKYIYKPDFIISNNIEFFKNTENQDIDNLTLALQDLIDGIPLIEVSKKYGRDFIVHYGHIKMLLNDIQNQIGGNTI